MKCDLVEQAPELSEIGAGLQVSPNASRILIALGLGEALQRSNGPARRKSFWPPADRCARSPMSRVARLQNERWGAPYGVMHRADLQTLLLDAVNAKPRCHLHLGQRLQVRPDIGELANRLGLPAPGSCRRR
jgi:salicylate hydroxylase